MIRLNTIYWLEVYDAIRGLMGYSMTSDYESCRIAEEYYFKALLEGRGLRIIDVCRVLRDPVCVVGGSADLEYHVSKLYKCRSVIAANGSSTLLLSYGVVPDVIVTDLDGSWDTLIKCSKLGSILVVHAHGDNIHAIKSLLPHLDNIVITCQTPPPIGYATILGGFTDGDRAIVLSLYCGYKPKLYGMNFRGLVGWWSKPWLKESTSPWPEKRAKLRIGEIIASLLSRLW